MTQPDNQSPDSNLTTTGKNRAIRHLKQSIIGGTHWYIALLEAIEMWDITQEIHDGRTYHYLIAGEAFDWLVLAERLCREVDRLLPEDEKNALLFHGIPPISIPESRFKELIGSIKYKQYLNYFYGITVEEALVMAVQEEVRKERRISGYAREKDTTNEVYRRIYGSTKAILLKQFRRAKKYPQLKSTSLTEIKEFNYWLFKYRLSQCDKARVASDTKKALNWLNNNGLSQQPSRKAPEPVSFEITPWSI
jgi:hypothetical protein